MRVPPHGMQDSRCLSDDDITALLEGQLVDAPLREAHAHLAECAACRTLWTTAAQARSASSLTMTPVASGAPLVEAAKTSLLPSGTNVGRFVVLRIVGSGGMGVVYSAYDPELDRKVALKFLRLHRSGSDETEQVLRQCLQREAKAMARIVHPSVITVYDIGTFASDVFIAMELVDGFTFSEWCAARPRRRDEILALLRKAGEGLAAAHRVGIIHRDFKPSNVLVSTRGEVRITDFGLARLVRQRDVSPSPGPEVPRPSVSSEMSSMLTSAAVGTPRARVVTGRRLRFFLDVLGLVELPGGRWLGSLGWTDSANARGAIFVRRVTGRSSSSEGSGGFGRG